MLKYIYFTYALLFALFLAAGDWSSMEIIDAHAHIGSFRGFDVSLQTLLENMNRYGIKKALISNLDGADTPFTSNEDEQTVNEATRKTVEQYPEKFRGLLWARPEDGKASNIESFLQDPHHWFVGIKFHPEFNHYDADDPRVDSYLQLCEKFQIAAVFHCSLPGSHSSPERIYAIAKRHPSVPIVLYHMVFFGPHEKAIQVAKQAIERQDANLYLETAQVDPESVLEAIRQVGSERVIFGTDATYYGKEHYSRYEPMIRLLRKELNDSDFANVFHKNAERIFKLNEH